MIADKKIVARFNGKMEYGSRALGNRSILVSAADTAINDRLNKHLKRTEFIPFAPSIMKGYVNDMYKNYEKAKYAGEFMTISFDVTNLHKKLAPAATHIDNTARPQTVTKRTNPSFYKILKYYNKITGSPVFINTSFNAHEELIVCSPVDAINAFKRGIVDVLSIGNFIIKQ